MVGRILDKSTTITMCPTINSHHHRPVRGPCSTTRREQRTLRWRGRVVGVPTLGASRMSCPLCAMHLHLGKLLAAPFDADHWQGRVVAALPLGAHTRHARCAQCAYVWASCLQRHSTQIVGEAVSWLLLPWPTHVVPHCARCACVWATCSQRHLTQIAKLCHGCSRPGSPSASCLLCAMRLRLGNLLAAPFDADRQVVSRLLPPWEPECVMPTVRDAPAFGQPAHSAVQRRSPIRVAAAPTLGARARCACCARCACIWATCSQRRSTQIGEVVSWLLPPWGGERVVPAVRDAPAFGERTRGAARRGATRSPRRSSARLCRGCSCPGNSVRALYSLCAMRLHLAVATDCRLGCRMGTGRNFEYRNGGFRGGDSLEHSDDCGGVGGV
jgi:hypothetical protein